MTRHWLVDLRKSKKLTQEEVSSRAAIQRAYYGQIEIGARRPSVAIAKRIALVLGFDWTLFFDQISSETQQKNVT